MMGHNQDKGEDASRKEEITTAEGVTSGEAVGFMAKEAPADERE